MAELNPVPTEAAPMEAAQTQASTAVDPAKVATAAPVARSLPVAGQALGRISMRQFIETGVHFGHQTRRWHPQMRPYIFGTRNGVHIIDLRLSQRKLSESLVVMRAIATQGKLPLFVGTKLQARGVVREEAERCGAHYINGRWLGGLLTNFQTVKQSVKRMERLEEMRGAEGTYEGIIKKEAVRLEKKRLQLERALGGIRRMRGLPGALFVIDCQREHIALLEARRLNIPIMAVVDTNCDPRAIDHVIPGNDDAIRSIRLFCRAIGDAVLAGRADWEAQMRSRADERPHARSLGRERGGGRAQRAAASREGVARHRKPSAETQSPAAKSHPAVAPSAAAESSAKSHPAVAPSAAAESSAKSHPAVAPSAAAESSVPAAAAPSPAAQKQSPATQEHTETPVAAAQNPAAAQEHSPPAEEHSPPAEKHSPVAEKHSPVAQEHSPAATPQDPPSAQGTPAADVAAVEEPAEGAVSASAEGSSQPPETAKETAGEEPPKE